MSRERLTLRPDILDTSGHAPASFRCTASQNIVGANVATCHRSGGTTTTLLTCYRRKGTRKRKKITKKDS